MTVSCPCGGRYHRTDIGAQPGSRNNYQTVDRKTATWRCPSCGQTRKQGLRQPRQENRQ